MTTGEKALEIADLNAWYDESHVLHGINLNVRHGECVALLGRNGAGRTTTLRAALGLTSRRTGLIRINGTDALNIPTYKIVRLGVGYCPEERAVYGSLTCEENLLLPPIINKGGMSLEEIYELFPNLYRRRHSSGMKLSGGEQQMVALARILRTGVRLLLLDEISEGLAPAIVEKLQEIICELKKRNYTIVLVEQNFEFATSLADRLCVIEYGKTVAEYSVDEITEKQDELRSWLGV